MIERMPQYKTCPFCGGDQMHIEEMSSDCYWIYCASCGAHGPEAKTADFAWILWNKTYEIVVKALEAAELALKDHPQYDNPDDDPSLEAIALGMVRIALENIR